MAIEFKLRQEKRGGFLLVRRRGKAFELSQPQFDLLLALHSAGGVPAGWPSAGIARYFGPDPMAGRLWWQSLAAMGLTDETGLKTLQLIPLVDNPGRVPDDCLAAPARVYLEITRNCNLSCQTCFNNSHRPLAGELATGEILDLLDQLDRLGTFEIRFTGGEPTTHPDFDKIVSSARKLGFRISLGTNGVYDDRVRSWIYESGVDWFIVSLDGMEDVNDRVRGPGTYRQVMRTLGELASDPQLHVRLNMVVARHNVHDIEPMARLADEYGVEGLNMIPLRPYGRSAKAMAALMFDQADFYSFIRQVQELRQRYRVRCITTLDLLDPEATTSHDPIVQKKRTCAAGVEAAVIGATGDVYGCSYSPASFPDSPDVEGRRLFVAGNVRPASLHDIWRDSARWAVFRYLDVYKNRQCQTCPQYTVRCVGSCPIMGYFKAGHPDAPDPYCFVDLAEAVR